MGQKRLPPRAVGIGALPNIQGLLAAQGISLPSGLLTPAVTSALQLGYQTAATLQPAASLAATIASGGVPTEAATVAGLAAVAGVINPIAGAAVAAAGTFVTGFSAVLQGIFSALGLYSPPQPSWTYNGFIRVGIDVVPDGVTDPDWLHIGDSLILTNAYYYGVPALNRPPISPNANAPGSIPPVQWWGAALNRVSMPWVNALWRPINQCVTGDVACAGGYPAKCNLSSYASGTIEAPTCGGGSISQTLATLADFQTIGNAQLAAEAAALAALRALALAQGKLQIPAGTIAIPASTLQAIQSLPGPFEQFFNVLLAKNFEFWANGQGYLPVRTLLAAAVAAWNSTHAGPGQIVYPGTTTFDDRALVTGLPSSLGGSAYVGGDYPYSNMVRAALSPGGATIGSGSPELTDTGPIVVNSGALETVSAGGIAALATIGAVTAGAVGLGIYSWATQQAASAVAKRIWKALGG